MGKQKGVQMVRKLHVQHYARIAYGPCALKEKSIRDVVCLIGSIQPRKALEVSAFALCVLSW